MSWRMDSSAGAHVWDTEPMTREDLALRDEEIAWLQRQGRPWRLTNGRLRGGRGEWRERGGGMSFEVPVMNAEGTYGALGAYPVPAELASVTPTATEASLIIAANLPIYLPLPINGILAPQAYRFIVGGRVTTTATAANYTWTPRIGNANTSPSLGASAALAKTISITNAFFVIKGDLTIQAIGGPGLNSKAWGHFQAFLNSASGGGYTSWLWGSAAQASFDSTIAPGVNGGCIWLGVLASAAAADPWLVSQVHFMDWN